VFNALEESARPLGRISVEARCQSERDHAVGVETQVDAADIGETPREQPRKDEQGHRQGNLHGRKRRARPRRLARASGLTGLILEDNHQVGPRGVERRNDADDEACAQCEDRGGDDGCGIEREIDRARDLGR
jgi:hypothetical protein